MIRSLCANLAAAEKYQQSHFESAEIQEHVSKAQYFYATGFFLTHSPQVIRAMGKHAADNNKVKSSTSLDSDYLAIPPQFGCSFLD